VTESVLIDKHRDIGPTTFGVLRERGARCHLEPNMNIVKNYSRGCGRASG
jgi:hypothetical protein